MKLQTGKVTFDVNFTGDTEKVMNEFIDRLAKVSTEGLDLVWDNVDWTIEQENN